MVFGLTLGASPVNFVKKIQQKVCSKLIGVATKLLPKFFIPTLQRNSLVASYMQFKETYKLFPLIQSDLILVLFQHAFY